MKCKLWIKLHMRIEMRKTRDMEASIKSRRLLWLRGLLHAFHTTIPYWCKLLIFGINQCQYSLFNPKGSRWRNIKYPLWQGTSSRFFILIPVSLFKAQLWGIFLLILLPVQKVIKQFRLQYFPFRACVAVIFLCQKTSRINDARLHSIQKATERLLMHSVGALSTEWAPP